MDTYEYEDHTYPTQKRAKEVLGDSVCSPGQHDWMVKSKLVLLVCHICGLMRWKKHLTRYDRLMSVDITTSLEIISKISNDLSFGFTPKSKFAWLRSFDGTLLDDVDNIMGKGEPVDVKITLLPQEVRKLYDLLASMERSGLIEPLKEET